MQFQPGEHVRLDGLQREEFNGQTGTVTEYLVDSQRYIVKLKGSGQLVAIKPINITKVEEEEYDVVFFNRPLGLTVWHDKQGNNAIVLRINSREAIENGVIIGSRIVAVNNLRCENLPHQQILEIIKAQSMPMHLRFKPPGEGDELPTPPPPPAGRKKGKKKKKKNKAEEKPPAAPPQTNTQSTMASQMSQNYASTTQNQFGQQQKPMGQVPQFGASHNVFGGPTFGKVTSVTQGMGSGDTNVWQSEILPNLDALINTERVKFMVWQGIPAGARGDVWSAMIGDQLGIEQNDYAALVQQGKALLQQNKQLENLVRMDIERTFPALNFFSYPDGVLYQPLLESLCAFIAYRTDFGYIQGISYLAAMLHLHMKNSPYTAFVSFTNLISIVENFQLANTENPDLNPSVVVFRNLMAMQLPQINRHFSMIGVQADQFIFTWFIPIFCHGAPLEISSRIWDNYLYSGDVFLFRCALGVLHALRDVLLNAQYDAALYILQNFGEFIDEQQLFDSIGKFDVTYEQMIQASRVNLKE